MSDLLFFLTFLYRYIKLRLFLWFALIASAAVFEGVGVGIFLPLLQGEAAEDRYTRLIALSFEAVGLPYTFPNVLAVMVGFFFLAGGFLIFQNIYVMKIITRLLVDLKTSLVGKLYQADYQYLLSRDIGFFTNAVIVEYGTVAFAFEKCMNFLVAAAFAVIYLSLSIAISPLTTVSVIALGIPAYFIFGKINRITRTYSERATANNALLQSSLIQALHNFKYLKATNSGSGILGKVYHASEQQGNIFYKQSILQAVTTRGVEPFMVLIVAGLLFYQVEILGRQLLEILFILFVMRRTLGYLLNAQGEYRKFIGATGSVRVFQQLESDLQVHHEDPNPGGAEPDFDQPIRFRQVRFAYGDGSPVLENIDLEIPPRSTVAFVGPSGAGKSTLVTLLTGLLQPTGGAILIGERSYSEINRDSLRNGIGYVTQESVIFNDTIANNISLWSDQGSQSRVEASAVRAHLKDFIEHLPHTYHTLLGDNGLNVSGGQRQRISIARELYKDVKLLIFDEATSSLDTQSERAIQQNIDEFQGEKTVVLIAHRLSTVRNSDIIFVLKDGRIVEQGSYRELYRRNGEFRAMVDQQMGSGEMERQEAPHPKAPRP